jgi:hypothetical protein
MTSSTETSRLSATRPGLGRAALTGAVAGILASIVMAVYAMIAAWINGVGFFTPLYHIASVLISPNGMMSSMEAAGSGNAFHFLAGPALLGAIIHMMTGAMYGAVFGILITRVSLSKGILAAAGLAYGAVVFAVSTWIALPLAAGILNSGDQIKNMAAMAGWGTFFIEHLLFGLSLGVLLAVRPGFTRSRR